METQKTLNVKMGLVISLAVVGLMCLASLITHYNLPAGGKFPMHWNAAGKVNRYGPRMELLLVYPVTALLLTLLMAALPRIEPRAAHLKQSRKAYFAMWLSPIALLAYAHSLMLWNSLGHRVNMLGAVGTAVGLMIVIAGNYSGKLRSNFFAGFRTPWTLSSELSWSKTHRLGGKLFVIYGVAVMAVSLIIPSYLLHVTLLGLTIVSIVTVWYSWYIWKNDPARKLAA